jgi:hypothetical protein
MLKKFFRCPIKNLLFHNGKGGFSVPGEIRTPDRRLRRPLLYPAELLGHVFHTIQFRIFIFDILSLPLPADSRKPSASRQLAAVSWKCGSSLSYWDMYFTLFNFIFPSLISCLFLYQLILRKPSASRQLAAVSWKCGLSLSYWDMIFN